MTTTKEEPNPYPGTIPEEMWRGASRTQREWMRNHESRHLEARERFNTLLGKGTEMNKIADEVTRTNDELYETALRLYEDVGVSAVLEWGKKIRLRFSLCEMCEVDTPEVGDEGDTYCCIVCGSLK